MQPSSVGKMARGVTPFHDSFGIGLLVLIVARRIEERHAPSSIGSQFANRILTFMDRLMIRPLREPLAKRLGTRLSHGQ